MTNLSGIPNYEVKEFAAKKARYCLCIFVLNEGARIRKQLKRCSKISDTVDIIIADGGSTDNSLDPSFLLNQGVRTLLTKAETGRLGTQLRMAMHYALEQGYQGVVTMDGNNKDNPEHALRFLSALDEGYDHVQGSRYIAGGKAINTPILRNLGICYVHAPLISFAAGFRYTDTTNGFRAYSKALLTSDDIALFRPIFVGYELHYYLAIRAANIGMRVKEVPVTRSYPRYEKTPTKITPIKGNLTIIVKLLMAVLGQFNPPKNSADRAAS
ncbi:hypothetical protein GCM10007094_41450 [Pseudovibrio japonicus]|uniref:Glycosyltransferase 2-like domain-containing protein n=1 Tax=Pseudovibrio japonicus TaxID=366534 RepID=A0ABQ3EN40_9HYPH|nr:glycosyltransferase family 2 protein [Pseudovibrio japonicus]GHB47849.1 hypothetical protein GCM10007094_41450 [Pseudovibrio japonicus]